MALIFLTAPVPNTFHSMESADWYTPVPYVEAAREVMGGIDLDPASSYEANLRVRATKYYTEEEDGLVQAWRGRVFLNPPGGKDGVGALVPRFWVKLVQAVFDRDVEEAIWIGYSLQQLQTLQGCPTSPIQFPICVPKRRIAFIENEAKRAERIAKLLKRGKKPNKKSQPSHANYVSYLGPHVTRFAEVFSRFGLVRP